MTDTSVFLIQTNNLMTLIFSHAALAFVTKLRDIGSTEPIRPTTRLAWLIGRQFAILTPPIALAMVVFFVSCLAWLALLAGLSPAEFAVGFVQEAAPPAVGAAAKLGMVSLCFAAAAGFGLWCQWQAKQRLDEPLLPRVLSLVAALLTLNAFLNPLRRITSPALSGRLLLRAHNLGQFQTPAESAGALPLLV